MNSQVNYRIIYQTVNWQIYWMTSFTSDKHREVSAIKLPNSPSRPSKSWSRTGRQLSGHQLEDCLRDWNDMRGKGPFDTPIFPPQYNSIRQEHSVFWQLAVVLCHYRPPRSLDQLCRGRVGCHKSPSLTRFRNHSLGFYRLSTNPTIPHMARFNPGWSTRQHTRDELLRTLATVTDDTIRGAKGVLSQQMSL